MDSQIYFALRNERLRWTIYGNPRQLLVVIMSQFDTNIIAIKVGLMTYTVPRVYEDIYQNMMHYRMLQHIIDAHTWYKKCNSNKSNCFFTN